MERKESNSSKHFTLSMVKSVIRIIGAFAIMYMNLPLGGIMFLIAELFGIIEEI